MTKRARDAGASVIIPFTKREIIRRDYPDGKIFCYLCGESLTEDAATIDHVLPLALGGAHCANNVKIACKSCNSAKGKKTLIEYLNR
jgi:5-methylcytosine-specific restriction endonuclease McrA